MRYFCLEPEVAGELGKNTVMNSSVHPPFVEKLHYEFEGWLGDDLLESFPCFIVTERLKEVILEEEFTGCSLDDVEVSRSPIFVDLYPERRLPTFYWLKITGKAGVDDFGISKDHGLVVSEKVLECFKDLELDNCDVEPFEEP